MYTHPRDIDWSVWDQETGTWIDQEQEEKPVRVWNDMYPADMPDPVTVG